MATKKTRESDYPLIKVVGVSAGGKSTLVKGLRAHGYNARAVSQEHSNVRDLWQQFAKPWMLIFLDITLEGQRRRRPDVSWSRAWHFTELDRLHHARSHADLQVNTTDMSADEVLHVVLIFLEHAGVAHADEPLPPPAATGTARAPINDD
jgi:hypothetical protein